jgi:putative membrane protein
LIFGGLPVIFKYAFKKEHKKDFGPLSVILFIVFFGIVLFQTFFKSTRGDVNLTINIGTVILLLVLGLIASATMIIPGVSGSMMLMTLGYYNPVISTVSSFVKALLKWNVKQLFHDAGILIPFGIGVIAGILLMAKLIEFLLKKYELNTYMAILGLVLASPFAILAGIGFGVVNALSVITGIVTFAIGFVAALFLSKE